MTRAVLSSLSCLSLPLLVACGSPAPNEPSATAAAAAPSGAGVRKSDAGGVSAVKGLLTIVSGEDDRPISGASVTVAGRPLTTDASGQVTAPDPVLADAPIEITASGFLKRETLARSDTRFTLWPDRSGFSSGYTQETVYGAGFTQDTKLTRPAASVFIVFAPEVDADGQSTVRDAAAALTSANGGQIVFSVGAAPGGAPTVTVKINSGASFFSQNPQAAAFAEVPFIGNTIGASNGTLNFKDASVSHIKALAMHELGHHFGLGHPASLPGIMNAAVDPGRSDYAEAEKLIMRMMLKRRPGNAFPDNDRAVTGASRTRGVMVYGCELMY